MPDAFLQFVPSRAALPPRSGRFLLILLLVCGGGPALGAELDYAISGVDEELLANVQAHVESFSLTGTGRVMPGHFDDAIEDAKQRASDALKPYGYYHPNITTNLVQLGPESWQLRMRIEPGPPVRVTTAEIAVRGPGSGLGLLQEWKAKWPLTPGAVLDQQSWQRQKESALQAANSHGYLSAEFEKEAIRIDLIRNEAALELVLETGEQAHFGRMVFEQDVVHPQIVADIPRFEPGTPYRQDLVNKLRIDLWQTGYFTDIEVVEQKNLDSSPPTVDIIAKASSETRDTYQGTIGFGTDTGVRAQLFWSRRPVSANGDRLDVGVGYQAIDDEFSLRTDYRIPRGGEGRQFWVANLTLQRDKQDLEVKRQEDDENFVTLAPGSVDDILFRFGKLQVRHRELGQDQVFETWFVQYLRESYDYDPGPDADAEIRALLADPRTSTLFRDTIRTVALGIEWDWPSIRGSGFSTDGHHERAWIFTSNEVWGSDREFTQIYVSSRRSWLRGERWKYLLRAEAGVTDADVDELALDVGGEPFELSITELPNHYRFKAGGGSSVRGYGFEELSNNDIGSNNIIAASAEIEMRVLPKWSVAAFVDIGNAFNDWSEFELRKGAGVGVRWYSVAGALRLDFARALDLEGKPWAVHFSIGTPLL